MLENFGSSLLAIFAILGALVALVVCLFVFLRVVSFVFDGEMDRLFDRFADWQNNKARNIRMRRGTWGPRRVWLYVTCGTLLGVTFVFSYFAPGLLAAFAGIFAAFIVGMFSLPFLLNLGHKVSDDEVEVSHR